MPVISGQTSGSIAGTVYNIPSKIVSYRLCNVSASTITVNVGIIEDATGTLRNIGFHTLNKDHCDGLDVDIIMPSGFTIYISASGTCDYWVTVTNI